MISALTRRAACVDSASFSSLCHTPHTHELALRTIYSSSRGAVLRS